MHLLAFSAPRKFLLASATVACVSLASILCHAQPDPPAQAGRISYISGNVSIQPAGSEDWGQAVPNLPLGPGDRIFTDEASRAEIQVGQTFVRVGPNADVSLVDSTPDGLYFGIAQGSVHVRVRGLWEGQSVYLNTPNGSSTTSSPGEVRVDVIPDQDATVFSTFEGDTAELITGAGGFAQNMDAGQALELIGSNPVTPQWLDRAVWDDLDQWGHVRDQQIAAAISYRYVSREIPGAYEMDAAGTWQPGTPYGAVWFPNNVSSDWAPYHNGHWVNHAPWGWVWVEDESWGYAPFHYGRWVSLGGRWGWIPGPPAAHPVWSPALVVFAGGIHVGGVGVSAWFPLGPGEAYRPWYPCSPRYVDQVNITNIIEAPRVHVQTTYVNINVVNVTYVNRTIAVTAMRQEDFAAGRPARQAAVAVDVHQFEHVQPLAAPEPRPTPQSFVGHPPARPVPVAAARPVLINAKGMSVAATPGARPVPPPVKAAPPIRALAGHTAVAPPPNAAKPLPAAKTPPAPMKPEVRTAPAVAAPARPAPGAAPKMPPPPAERPVAPPPTPKALPPPVENRAVPPAPKPLPPPIEKPNPPVTPKTLPPPANKPVVPPPVRPLPPPAERPTAPPAPKPDLRPMPEPPAKAPPRPADKAPTEPPAKPPYPATAKPAGEPAPPPKVVKPGAPPPPKTDKNKKDDKDKEKKDEPGPK